MPLYQFNICFEMTEAERQKLVDRVIKIHTEQFHTPTFLVNVVFQDVRAMKGALHLYRAGKPHIGNAITGIVRPGDRTPTAFNTVILKLVKSWAEIINGGKTTGVSPERQLMGCFIQATVNAAWEHGFLIPEGGQDAIWLHANRKAIEAAAQSGEEDFKYTLQEMDNRSDLQI